MTDHVERAGLKVAAELADFLEAEALPGTCIEAPAFWAGMAGLFARFAPENAVLLGVRDRMQAEIDAWHLARRGQAIDPGDYQAFLRGIGYLVEPPAPFQIDPGTVDAEVTAAGPQLVVPVLNPRFVLNAANARWGSLYDALYGSDAISGERPGGDYDPARGAQVIAWARDFLDRAIPLAQGCWRDFAGGVPDLARPELLVGRAGDNLLFRHNGLHIELVIDRSHPIGANDPAGIADVILESALSTIVDFEDSVAAVDGADKAETYRNWLGLIRGTLEARVEKNGEVLRRTLAPDRAYTAPDGTEFTLLGRSLLFVRNVGHLMTTPAVLLPGGAEAPEGILDALITGLIGVHDLSGTGRFRNSRACAIYIVKPKMHGPDEARFSDRLFDAVEDIFGLPRHTIKIGVMDEERRTSANLAACIAAVKDRIVFINTGFLDRTGDEIHTSMRAGPMVRKGEMKSAGWIGAYEDRNVQIGLACGFAGRAQIGKGMWAAPDAMADMLTQKIAHPMAGASTAWVPSPTAATLHATHYHLIDVAARQAERRREKVAPIDALLMIPLTDRRNWSVEDVRAELDNNAQGILGYVVRWIDQGIGCSKVPDISDTALMEDRATLRISSQHMANWLLHGVCSESDIEAALDRMAAKVDAQNANDPSYRPLRAEPRLALAAARALILQGGCQPNGYTEPLLHHFRRQAKMRRVADTEREAPAVTVV
jgi:malate synthase